MRLSGVYENGYAYAVAYDNGSGEYELLNGLYTSVNTAQEAAKKANPDNFVGKNLFVVVMQACGTKETVKNEPPLLDTVRIRPEGMKWYAYTMGKNGYEYLHTDGTFKDVGEVEAVYFPSVEKILTVLAKCNVTKIVVQR